MSFSPLGSLSLSNINTASHGDGSTAYTPGYSYSGDHCVPPPPPASATTPVTAATYGHPCTYSRVSSRSSSSGTSTPSATGVASSPSAPSAMNISPRMKASSITGGISSPKSSHAMNVSNMVDGVPMAIVSTPSSSALSPSRRAIPQLATSLSSPRSGRIHTPKSLVALPDHIASLNGRWDGECSIHGSGSTSVNGMTLDSEKTNVWLGCHLAFSPLDGSCTFEHPHNDAALCYATYRIRGHGHSIGSVDGSSRKLIPFQLNGLLDGTSGAFELTVTSHEGEYQSALTSHGTVDFANRSMMADSKGRVGTLRLSFSGNQNTMTSTLRPHLSPKAVAKHLGLLSSAECGSGRPRSGAVLAKVITPAIAPCTPSQQLTPGTTAGPDPLSLLTSKDGAVRVWQGQLVRHGTEHTAILSECVLAFNVSNDVGTIIGTGMASWEGYRVSFTLEGSFDHKHRVTVVWAEVAVKLMTEPPQCEKYTVCIDVATRRIEGHNPFGRLKLEPYHSGATPQVVPPSSYNMAKMNEQQAINQQAAINASHHASHSSGNIATTMVPTMMSQNQNMAPYPAPSNLLALNPTGDGIIDGNIGGGGMDAYGTNGGMMYGPQVTPQGITYTLMPTAMAMQAHAVTAQMLYGVNSGSGYGAYAVDATTPGSIGGENATPIMTMTMGDATFMTGHDGSEGMNTSSDGATSSVNSNSSSPVDGRSRSNSLGTNTSSGTSAPSSGPASPIITPTTSGTVSIDPSLPMDDTAASGAAGAPTVGMVRPRRYSVTTSSNTTPRNRSGSDASSNSGMHAPLQQFEIGDRVYMYTLPSNIVQSVLLRGPITAQALKDSPYPYHSPRQLHYNPGVLVRSDRRTTARRLSQSRGSGQGGTPVKLADGQRRTSGSTNTSPTSSQSGSGNTSNDASPMIPAVVSPSSSISPQQQRVVGMSPNPNAAGGKKASSHAPHHHNKWPTIKGVRANPTTTAATNANNAAPGGPRM